MSYSWNTSPVQVSGIATGLAAGAYTVTVTAENACASTAAVEITEPQKIIVQLQVKDAVCTNADGSITTFIAGGTIPYIYKWNIPAENISSIDELAAGVYHLIVTDKNI